MELEEAKANKLWRKCSESIFKRKQTRKHFTFL